MILTVIVGRAPYELPLDVVAVAVMLAGALAALLLAAWD